MTPENQLRASASLNVALGELSAITRFSAEAKRNAFVKLFKQLSSAERAQLCNETAALLKDKFTQEGGGQQLDGVVYALIGGIAVERDWESARGFLNSVLSLSSDVAFFRELAIVFLEIADNEFEGKSSKIPLAQTSLVLLTEFGLLLANRTGQSSLSGKGVSSVVEYITTNLLARSNVNNNAMRISLVHFLSKCQSGNNATMQLGRVISRFGQSLLEDLFRAFFEDKKRENAAFYFLLEHLDSFFAASPALAEMSHNVLKHFMLKYPTEFPTFLGTYVERLPKESVRLRLATKHISLLLRSAIDVSQKALTESLLKVVIRHLESFDVSKEILQTEIISISNIVKGQGSTRKNELVDEVLLSLLAFAESHKITSADGIILLAKGTSRTRIKKTRETPMKLVKLGAEPSPLESMLQLAV